MPLNSISGAAELQQRTADPVGEEGDHDDALREMAQHRGFKLLKSRRRKPGVGDFGRFGLNDASGKPVMGVGPEGLTALPEEVEAFLRTGAVDSWRKSARDGPNLSKKAKATPAGDALKEAAIRPTPVRAKRKAGVPNGRPNKDKIDPTPSVSPKARDIASSTDNGASKKPRLSGPGKLVRSPELVIRQPRKGEAGTLAALLCALPGIERTADEITRDLLAIRKAGGGMLIADKGGPIGCTAWAIVATVHRGLIGRITALVVTPTERRKGVGRKLVEGALTALSVAGCTTVEAMSDIDIRNAHNFFRGLGFAQASYRFIRSIAQTET